MYLVLIFVVNHLPKCFYVSTRVFKSKKLMELYFRTYTFKQAILTGPVVFLIWPGIFRQLLPLEKLNVSAAPVEARPSYSGRPLDQQHLSCPGTVLDPCCSFLDPTPRVPRPLVTLDPKSSPPALFRTPAL